MLTTHRKWGARDRRFAAETVYDIVRWWRLLWAVEDREADLGDLRLWKLVGTHLALKGWDLPDWDEFKWVNPATIRARLTRAEERRAVRESVPDWLDDLGARELGEQWDAELHALNQPADVVLRANTLKTNRDELRAALAAEEIEAVPLLWAQDALVLSHRQNALATAAFKNGLFEVQDACSQLVGPLLGVTPGMRVVDACAGAGGKSLHLAALMQNKGRIVALDVDGRKLDELKRRARRDSVGNIETRVVDSSKVLKRLAGTADRLLLDVPCSGLGVLRRNPDAKWKLTPEAIERLILSQQEILASHGDVLRPGGRMVYATCSILPSENERQIEWFLTQQAGRYALVEQKTLLPTKSGFDGFFMALLERNS